MISVHNLIKNYSVEGGTTTRALAGVSFTIEKGEFVAIMGPSGSGKSTLLHILNFLDRPTEGSFCFAGHDATKLSDDERAQVRGKEMGFVFQAFNLLSRSNVYENVELPLLYTQTPANERDKRIKDALQGVGLGKKLQSIAATLSGGEKQRVAIARALVNHPNVIFADEPTGNLDSKSGAQVMGILAKLHKSGKTIILVTHETYTAEFANRIIRLKDGLIESDEKVSRSRESAEEFIK